MISLNEKTILIVGGSSGIGRAIAETSVNLGAKVIIASRSEGKLKKAASEMGSDVQVSPMDMTNEEAVKEWASNLPEVDYLVISASSAVHAPFASSETAPLRHMFDAKFFGPYVTAREVIPRMKAGGSIMLFSGVLSRRPGENCSGLGAVNGAVEAITRGMALELGPKLRVNCMSPGMVRSESYSALDDDTREAMYASTGESLPVGRVGFPAEIAHAVIASLTNGYLTGQIIDVDGGHMIRQYVAR